MKSIKIVGNMTWQQLTSSCWSRCASKFTQKIWTFYSLFGEQLLQLAAIRAEINHNQLATVWKWFSNLILKWTEWDGIFKKSYITATNICFEKNIHLFSSMLLKLHFDNYHVQGLHPTSFCNLHLSWNWYSQLGHINVTFILALGVLVIRK